MNVWKDIMKMKLINVNNVIMLVVNVIIINLINVFNVHQQELNT